MEQVFQKKIKRLGLLHRPDSKRALQAAQELASWLKQKKIEVYALNRHRPIKATKKLPKLKIPKLDMAIVIGGDGTYLTALHLLPDQSTPILGFNMGSLGFLTEFRAEDMYQTCEEVLAGKLWKSPRTMLEVKIQNRRKQKSLSYFALNEVVIERGIEKHLIHMELNHDKNLVCDMKADGLIISSPTGSTAYNLSAGGPILHPSSRSIAVTAISPHSLTLRPMIFSDEAQLCLSIQGEKQKAELSIDGRKSEIISEGDNIIIKKAKLSHCSLSSRKHDFFQTLREKLKFGERN